MTAGNSKDQLIERVVSQKISRVSFVELALNPHSGLRTSSPAVHGCLPMVLHFLQTYNVKGGAEI